MIVKRIPAPDESDAIALYPGIAPGSENDKQTEVWSYFGDQAVVRNVTRPTLTPVLPEPGKANGSAVILAPGGAFHFLAMENEGWPVAKWLADIGVTVFILKYRIVETPDSEADCVAKMMTMMADPTLLDRDTFADADLPIADAQAAVRMVRAGAAKWNLDPARIGLLGFSAGSAVALGVVLANDPSARVDFVVSIYGTMAALDLHADVPPLYAAMTSDDEFFGRQGFGLIENWKKMGSPVEFHMYEAGGHGFGAFPKGTTSDAWFEHFASWLKSRKLLDQ